MDSRYINLPYTTVVFEIRTKSTDVFNALSLLYGQYITSEKPTNKEKIFVIEIFKEKNTYRIRADSQDLVTDNPLQATKDILYENTQFSKSVMALHGAAVEYKGKAYLFLASTTSGKTTLTSYLTQKGIGYITDDCILIERDSLSVLPVSTPIHLREGGLQVLTKLHIDLPELAHLQNKTIDRYVYVPKNCASYPLSIARVYFILRNEMENEVRQMTGVHTVIKLMKSVMIPYRITDGDMKIFQQLDKSGCEEILYKDLEYVYSLICEA